MPKIARHCVWWLLLASTVAQAQTQLAHWPAPAAAKLDALIKAHAHRGDYAVFDADNTTYQYDLEESLLPYLEAHGVLGRDTLAPSLQPIPFQDVGGRKENLYAYYGRLCEVDEQLCYPWSAQVFAGPTLRELKTQVDGMLGSGEPIPVVVADGDGTKTIQVSPPKFFTGMQELYRKLMENGIDVYVVSASAEELVRMVLADPKYGYGVPPDHVIGVTLLLKNPATGEVTTARKRIAAHHYDPAALDDWVMTPTLWAPLTWFEGKSAAIRTYIDPWKKPILVAGDTPVSDGPMLFGETDVSRGGMRVWVNRKAAYLPVIEGMQRQQAAAQRALKLPVTADRNWIVVRPDEIR